MKQIKRMSRLWAILFSVGLVLASYHDKLLELLHKYMEEGLSLGFLITVYVIVRKELRNRRFDKRDADNYHNAKVIMDKLGVGDQWHGPVRGSRSAGLPSLRKLSFLSRREISLELKRRMKKRMERLKSRKFWLAIVGALIPVINQEFGLNLDSTTILAMIGVLSVAIASLAHVDGKKATAIGGATDAQHGTDSGPAV